MLAILRNVVAWSALLRRGLGFDFSSGELVMPKVLTNDLSEAPTHADTLNL